MFKRRRVESYRNPFVVRRIMREQGVDQATATQWFYEMLRFLDVCADARETVSPSEPVDHAWHAFILHTREYEGYCKRRYGRMIHHDPTDAADPVAYARAYRALERRHGERDDRVWPPASYGRGPGAGCGAGTAGDGGSACGSSCGGGCGGGGCGGGGG